MSLEVREIKLKLTARLCDLLEFARKTGGGDNIPLSQFVEDCLRESPLIKLRNRMAKIDFGSDADQPDWAAICAEPDESVGQPTPQKTSRRSSSKAATTASD